MASNERTPGSDSRGLLTKRIDQKPPAESSDRRGRNSELPSRRVGASATRLPTTWALVDLSTIEVVEEKTSVLHRLDGHALLYSGRVHSLHGESESGKTWVLLCAVVETLNLGGRVVYLDFEDRAASIVERLLALGVNRSVLNDPLRFGYVRPDEPLTIGDESWADLGAALGIPPALVVIDGVTESMELEGLDLNSNTDVARWMRLLPRAIAADTGAAVACIDHVTKYREGRGGYAIGGQHKKAGVDGAVYEVEMVSRFRRVLTGIEPETGLVAVRIRKDRPGFVRGISEGDLAASFEFTAWPDGGVTWKATTAGLASDFGLRRRIADYLRGAPGAPKRAVRDLGHSDDVDRAVAGMVEEGAVEIEIVGSAHHHTLTEHGEETYPRGEET